MKGGQLLSQYMVATSLVFWFYVFRSFRIACNAEELPFFVVLFSSC